MEETTAQLNITYWEKSFFTKHVHKKIGFGLFSYWMFVYLYVAGLCCLCYTAQHSSSEMCFLGLVQSSVDLTGLCSWRVAGDTCPGWARCPLSRLSSGQLYRGHAIPTECLWGKPQSLEHARSSCHARHTAGDIVSHVTMINALCLDDPSSHISDGRITVK